MRPHVALLALLLTGTAIAQPPSEVYSFAGLQWYSNKATVKSVLAKKGYTFSRVDTSDQFGDLIFEGKVADEEAKVVAIFNNSGSLVKVQVFIYPPKHRFINKYNVVRDSLVKKYGKPKKDSYSYDSPYKFGGIFQEDAIESGKATISSSWYGGRAGDQYANTVNIAARKDLSIAIDYDNYKWNAEYDRRNNRDTDDL